MNMTPERRAEAKALALKRLLDEKSSLAYAERLNYSEGKIAEIRHRVEIAEAEWWPWAEVDRLRAQVAQTYRDGSVPLPRAEVVSLNNPSCICSPGLIGFVPGCPAHDRGALTS